MMGTLESQLTALETEVERLRADLKRSDDAATVKDAEIVSMLREVATLKAGPSPELRAAIAGNVLAALITAGALTTAPHLTPYQSAACTAIEFTDALLVALDDLETP